MKDKGVFPGLALSVLRKLSGVRHIFPFYHLVSDAPGAHVKHLYAVKTVAQFERDLDFFLKHFQIADFPQVLNLKRPTFYLSFDDGLRECSEIIAPILLRKGIPATFFVNSDFVDNRDLFYKFKIGLLIDKLKTECNSICKAEIQNILNHPDLEIGLRKLKLSDSQKINSLAQILNIDFDDYLKRERPYMSTDQIIDLQNNGFKIGAHSLNHPLYSDLSLDDQLRQTADSLNVLKTKFNVQEDLFAFPFTDDGVSQEFFIALHKQFPNLYTFGTAGLKFDTQLNHFQRLAVERMPKAGQYLLKRLATVAAQKPFGKHVIKRT